MLNLKNVQLNKEMIKLVEEHVEAYKTDLEYDLDTLRDKENNCDIMYWMISKDGTNIIGDNLIFAEGSYENSLSFYYANESVKVYKVTVLKRGRIYTYGNLEELCMPNFLNHIKENTKKPKGIIRTVFFKKNNKINKEKVNINYDEHYYKEYDDDINFILDKLNICREDIQKIYTPAYIY